MSRNDLSTASGEGVADAIRASADGGAIRASADGGATLAAGMVAAAVRERTFRRADLLPSLAECR
jgi:hypothetical protein